MRILFLPAYFSPEQVSSSHLSCSRNEAFANAGFDMVVYTPMPTRGISKEIRKEYRKRKNETLYDGRMTVHRFRLMQERRNPLLRAIRYLCSCTKQLCYAVFAHDARQCDILFISSTPPIQGALAALIKKLRGIPFVYNLQDIFPDSLVAVGLARKGGVLWKIGRMIENFTYRNADKIIVISEEFKRNIMSKGVPESKIEIVYNWVDTRRISPVDKGDNPLYEEFGIDRDRFTVVYAGNLGNAQNIGVILSAAAVLRDVQFAIFGTGGQESEIRSRIETENLANVRLLPLQPYERVSYVYGLGDACIVSCKAGLGGSAMPSKTWSIMACGRPVIANFDEGELKEIIEKCDCGIFTHANDAVELAEAICTLRDNPSKCAEMGRNARLFIMNNLTMEVGTRRYVEIVKSAIPDTQDSSTR